ncbi:MAG TPA: cytochrome c peroxidase [Bryobacteraceae bacterium]|nr:cytochrome c peroxidase [Bryobacteraceae bacterium]
MQHSGRSLVLAAVAALAVSGCSRSKPDPPASSKPVGAAMEIKSPLGLPPLAIPPDNPPTAATIELGKKLFFETKLSRDNTIACSSCHNPAVAFTDGRKLSLGVESRQGTRNAPTVLNAAFLPVQFWDGRAATLEEQCKGPIANPAEMDQAHEPLVVRLNADPLYRAEFAKAFGPGVITIDHVAKAVASFERTQLSGNSPFDRYRFKGDKTALSPAALRGLAVFEDKNKGNCVVCHTIEQKHALFTDGKFHNLGVGLDPEGNLRDLGRYEQTKVESDKGAFRTPTLRDIAKTAPYMHDGSLKTLREVVDFYVGGGNSNPHLDKEMRELKLSKQDKDDLIAFMEALTGESATK